jgi:hypothetical protein
LSGHRAEVITLSPDSVAGFPYYLVVMQLAIFTVHIQNVQRHNVQAAKRPKYKTSKDITSKLQYVPASKRPSLKTSQASKRPNPKTSKIQNVPSLKTSQASKRPKPQNDPSLKTSQATRRLKKEQFYLIIRR